MTSPQTIPATTKQGRPPRILSGIQPSGQFTIGNYLGALKNWAALQTRYESFYCVVDLHAITTPHNPEELRARTRTAAGVLLACGLAAPHSTIFVQSHVSAHAELGWILATQTPLGWLNRMTQFKDKSAKQQADSVGTGLLVYPDLMAADILLYQADLVPVGDDQRQHIELTRDVAQRFNSLYGETFTVPDGFIPEAGARVMGLDNPLTKMSKSETSEYHAVYMLDEPDRIKKKLMRSVTDSGSGIVFSDDPEKAGVNNLLTIYQAFTEEDKAPIEGRFAGKGYGDLKKAVVEVVVEGLRPIQQKYYELTAEGGYIDEVLAQGAERAREIANKTLRTAYKNIGFLLAKE
jgi:tryptophanyl-tRNA synthetase